jgi:hypothetical protein
MATNLIQVLSEKENYIIYYDRDVFNQDVTLSIHLTVPNLSNSIGHAIFDNTSNEQWNTIYNEEFGTSGTSGQNNYYTTVSGVPQFIEQSLQDIAVQIWAIPTFAIIIGEGLVTISTNVLNYTLPLDYDPGNVYIYKWRLRKILQTDTDLTNSRATILGSNTVKNVDVIFTRNGFVNLECIIIGPTGCPRIIRKQICVELPLTKMLIIRNRLL